MKSVKVESTGYRGEYPAGVYWSVGEVREVPAEAVEALPVGLAVVKPAPAPKAAK